MKLTGNKCQCAACSKYFKSTAAFDKHRAGDGAERHCMTTEAMEAKGMAQNANGWWVTALNSRFAANSEVTA